MSNAFSILLQTHCLDLVMSGFHCHKICRLSCRFNDTMPSFPVFECPPLTINFEELRNILDIIFHLLVDIRTPSHGLSYPSVIHCGPSIIAVSKHVDENLRRLINLKVQSCAAFLCRQQHVSDSSSVPTLFCLINVEFYTNHSPSAWDWLTNPSIDHSLVFESWHVPIYVSNVPINTPVPTVRLPFLERPQNRYSLSHINEDGSDYLEILPHDTHSKIPLSKNDRMESNLLYSSSFSDRPSTSPISQRSSMGNDRCTTAYSMSYVTRPDLQRTSHEERIKNENQLLYATSRGSLGRFSESLGHQSLEPQAVCRDHQVPQLPTTNVTNSLIEMKQVVRYILRTAGSSFDHLPPPPTDFPFYRFRVSFSSLQQTRDTSARRAVTKLSTMSSASVNFLGESLSGLRRTLPELLQNPAMRNVPHII